MGESVFPPSIITDIENFHSEHLSLVREQQEKLARHDQSTQHEAKKGQDNTAAEEAGHGMAQHPLLNKNIQKLDGVNPEEDASPVTWKSQSAREEYELSLRKRLEATKALQAQLQGMIQPRGRG